MDWLSSFFASLSLPSELTRAINFLYEGFHALEPFIVLLGLTLIWQRLRKTHRDLRRTVNVLGKRVEEARSTFENFGFRLETLKQLVDALQQSLERSLANTDTPQADDGSANSWELVRSVWQQTRERIELAIEKIGPKAKRARYSKFDRYSYLNIIAQLQLDGVVTGAAHTALVQMNAEFNRLRRRPGRTIAADAVNFARWLQAVNGSLPKLPSSDYPPDLAPPPRADLNGRNDSGVSEVPSQTSH